MNEITVTELAKESGLSVTHIGQLIRRGILPQGRKEGKQRLLPYERSIMILGIHTHGKHWPKQFKDSVEKPKKKNMGGFTVVW